MGPNGGGTIIEISGAGFNDSAAYGCVFSGADPQTGDTFALRSTGAYERRGDAGASLAPPVVVCLSPQWPVLTGSYSRLSLEADGVPVSFRDGSEFLFYFTEGGWSSASPVTALAAVAFNITIVGQNFVPSGSYQAKLTSGLDSLASTACAVISKWLMSCLVNNGWPYAEGTANLALYNRELLVGKTGGAHSVDFQAAWSKISQRAGSVQGGQLLTITGHGFDAKRSTYYLCRFTGIDGAGNVASRDSGAQVLNVNELACGLPNWAMPEQLVRVSVLHGGDVMEFAGELQEDSFQYFSTWVRFRTLPSLGDTYGAWGNVDEDGMPYRSISRQGGTQITISGAGFSALSEHVCVFSCMQPCSDAPVHTDAQVVENDRFLTCTSPEWIYPFAGSHQEIEFSLAVLDNGVSYQMQHLGDPFKVFVTKASADFNSLEETGSLVGGYTISIRGASFCYHNEVPEAFGEGQAGELGDGNEVLNAETCASKFICQFTQISGSGDVTARSKQCTGGAAAGISCQHDSDCSGSTCSAVVSFGSGESRIVDETHMLCVTPAWPVGGAKTMIQILDVTTLAAGVQIAHLSPPGFFEYSYRVMRVSPHRLLASHSHQVTVTGSDFSRQDTYYCRVTLHERSKESEPVSPISDTKLVCTIPAWYQDTSAGSAQFELRNDLSGSVARNDGVGLAAVNITFLSEWGGFEDCKSDTSLPCSSDQGSTLGGVNLKIRAWSLKPLMNYTVRFVDQYGNSMEFPVVLRYREYSITELDRATWESYTVSYVDENSLSLEVAYGSWGATLSVGSWDYAAGSTEAYLLEQDVYGDEANDTITTNSTAVRTIVPSMDGADDVVMFEFRPCNSKVVQFFMPELGCSGACWPFELVVMGLGYDEQSAKFSDFQGNIDFIDYKCILSSGGVNVSASSVFVQDPRTIFCRLGLPQEPPAVHSGEYKVDVVQKGRTIDWTPGGRSVIMLTDAWTSTDCSRDSVCEGYASGSNSSINVRGFGFQSHALYKCNFKRGPDEANSTALLISPKLLQCKIPIWNYPEGIVKFKIVKDGVGELPYEGTGGVNSGYAHEFRFNAVWWFTNVQNGSVAGHISLVPTVHPGLDPGNALLTVHGRGFDSTFSYVVRVKNGTRSTTPDMSLLTSEYLNVSYVREHSSHMRLVMRMPQYLSYENVVSVDIFKCHMPEARVLCVMISPEVGTGLAYWADFRAQNAWALAENYTRMDSPAVTQEYRYYATYASLTMSKISDLEGDFTCFPSSPGVLCWVSSAGGDIIHMQGLGFVAHAPHMYRCKFSFESASVFSEPANASDGSNIECLVPPWPYPRGSAEVSIVRVADGTSLKRHTLYGAPQILLETQIDGVFPTAGPASGMTVTVTGGAFSTAEGDHVCLFSAPNASGIPYLPEQSLAVPGLVVTTVNASVLKCSVVWGDWFPAGQATLYLTFGNDESSLTTDVSGQDTLLTVSWLDGSASYWDRKNHLKPGMKLKIEEELLFIEKVEGFVEQEVRVRVLRGINGTAAVRHMAGNR